MIFPWSQSPICLALFARVGLRDCEALKESVAEREKLEVREKLEAREHLGRTGFPGILDLEDPPERKGLKDQRAPMERILLVIAVLGLNSF